MRYVVKTLYSKYSIYSKPCSTTGSKNIKFMNSCIYVSLTGRRYELQSHFSKDVSFCSKKLAKLKAIRKIILTGTYFLQCDALAVYVVHYM